MNKLRQFASNLGSHNITSSLLAIFLGLLIGFIGLLITSPENAVPAFQTMLRGGFGNMRHLGNVLHLATPIIMTGLSVGFALRTGLFNIGAAGQFIVGAYIAILIGVVVDIPAPWHWMLALAGAMAGGALWGMLPGLLKAYRNVHEVISCIMLNYIGMFGVNYAITLTIHDTMRNQTERVRLSAELPRAGLDQIFRDHILSSSAGSGIFIAIISAIIIYIIIEKTKFGYELKACGFNSNAAKYAGINEKRSIIFSMMISGALAGLGGALLYLAGAGNSIDVVDVLAYQGFQGIPVALLGLSHPIGIIFSGLFIAHLQMGGFLIQLLGFPPETIDVIIAIIIYFSAFALIIKSFLGNLILRKNSNDSNNNTETTPETGGDA